MKLLVLGAGGELGRQVGEAAERAKAFEAIAALTHRFADVTSPTDIFYAMHEYRPDVVINCAGIVRGREVPDHEYVEVNALGPYLIARGCERIGAKLVQISTDCVFSGKNFRRWYMPDDVPDPIDLYGRTKAMGEVRAEHVAVVRTSFTGRTSRLWRWLESAEGEVEGWGAQMWSGSTSRAVAETLVGLIAADEIPWGDTIHLATASAISKLEAVQALVKHLGRDLTVRTDWSQRANMALCPTVTLPSFVEELAREKVNG